LLTLMRVTAEADECEDPVEEVERMFKELTMDSQAVELGSICRWYDLW
jgi:hypothetical protein